MKCGNIYTEIKIHSYGFMYQFQVNLHSLECKLISLLSACYIASISNKQTQN